MMRLDKYLTDSALCESRSEAQRLIHGGYVRLNGKVCFRASQPVSENDLAEVDRRECRYVSRAGLKLEGALQAFRLSPEGQVALDVGASTGGFTDCLLQNGAVHVYALENGSGQLSPSLLSDSRVTNMEHRNARYLTVGDFDRTVTFVTMDVSFISQTLILPALSAILPAGATLISLIKPQFEVGRSGVGKGGIVKREADRQRAVLSVCQTADATGFESRGVIQSPICGGDGNIEYLAYFVKRKDELPDEKDVTLPLDAE